MIMNRNLLRDLVELKRDTTTSQKKQKNADIESGKQKIAVGIVKRMNNCLTGLDID